MIAEHEHHSVSIIVACLNEVDYIKSFLECLQRQHRDFDDFGILIADGMSEDGTRKKIEEFSEKDPSIRLLDNPERIVSTGLNRAIREARGDVILRMDVHTEYSPDYIMKCLEVLEQTGADNVGGPARTKAKGYVQQAICLAYHSSFSVGGAKFHKEDYEGYVDTVTYGCWRRQTLEELGLFDQELVRNQDDELNLRLIRRGGRIWQSKSIRSWYYPRSRIRALFKQYLQYGYWKVRVIQKHSIPASPRHIVPAAFLGSLIILSFLSLFDAALIWIMLAILGAYAFANLMATILACHHPSNWRYMPIMPLVFAAYHFGYGLGFLAGFVDFVLLRRAGQRSFSQSSRQFKGSQKIDRNRVR